MSQLDRFIQVLHERGGDRLTLQDGRPISLTVGDRTVPVTRTPVAHAQIETLIRELATLGVAERRGGDATVAFSYHAPTGPVDIEVRRASGGIEVMVQPAVGEPPAAAPPEAPPPRGGAPEPGPSADLDGLLRRLVQAGGSDLHLRVGEPPLFRRDGRLAREREAPCTVARIGAMLDAILPPKDKAQYEATGDADFAYEIPGLARFRVNVARDRGGPMTVLRVIPSAIPTCDQLDITPEVRNLCYLTKGLVVITGPTGSGKSTTLAALVDLINREREEHILTIEDPIEFVHQSGKCLVTHRQVGLHTQSFKAGLRAALREDPDIVLIGEMRDLETVAIAIETAETGHLVFGTLHTTTAASTVDRIIDQFPADRHNQIRVMLSESLRGVVAQVLCRRIGGGRVAAREILFSTPAVSNLIREGKTFQLPSIMQTSKKLGMITLNDALLDLVARKVIEPKEAYMKSVEKEGLLSALRARNLDTSFVKT